MQPSTAVAVREEHPIIAQIDAKMPEIAAMLPEGMRAERFRKVVVQALVKNPDLWACTPVSVVSAIVEAAEIGLEPTGVLGRAWMLPYSNKGTKEAKLIVGYRGYAELAWRADQIVVTTGAVRVGDEFSYQRGTDAFLRHVPASDDPDLEANDANITHFWAMYTLPDGRREFEVMSRKAAERIRDKARYRNPVWESDFGEMGRKTVLRRLLKVAPLSPEVQRVLGADEEIDFDTPVERVADDRSSAARDRIAERTEAIRAGKQEEQPVNDVWMREIHGKASERGVDHERLSAWAKKKFGVESMKDLTPSQRADMTLALEKLPVIEQPPAGERDAATEASAPDLAMTPQDGAEQPEESTTPVDPDPASSPPGGGGSGTTSDGAVLSVESGQPAPSGDLTIEAVLEASGGIDVTGMPEHGTAAYVDWFNKQDRPKRQQLRAQGLGPSDKPKGARATPEPSEVPA